MSRNRSRGVVTGVGSVLALNQQSVRVWDREIGYESEQE
jgi:hypothetical protein